MNRFVTQAMVSLVLLLGLLSASVGWGQAVAPSAPASATGVTNPPPASSGITIYKNPQNTTSVRMILLVQFWMRSVETNPGSSYKNKPADFIQDFSLRRANVVLIAQASPRLLMLVAMGGSANIGGAADQPGFAVGLADVYGEYKISDALFVGAGLNQWAGFSRLNLDGVGTLLNADLPQFQFATFNRWDRLNRHLGVYAKGRLDHLTYRLMVSDPFALPTPTNVPNAGRGSAAGAVVGGLAGNAQLNVGYLNPDASAFMTQGYAQWEFLDREANVTPYETSVYFGKKRFFNLGAGFMYRPQGTLTPTRIEATNPALPASDANPRLIRAADVRAFTAYAVDAYLDYPLGPRQSGVNLYAGYFNVDMGRNYYTVTGINNLAGSLAGSTDASRINGVGNAFPATGTGQTLYAQAGYLAPLGWLGSAHRFGVFGTYQHSQFDALRDPVQVYEAGANCFLAENMAKLTLQYRNRPVFGGIAAASDESTATLAARRGEWVLQLQLNF